MTKEAVWASTTCGACVEVRPVGNAPMTNITDIRRDILMANREPDDAGWLVRLRPTNIDGERGKLVDACTAFVQYQERIEELRINCMRCMD